MTDRPDEPSSAARAADRTILGISDSHDAGAAIVRGGQLLAAVNEERLTRRKMQSGFPERSIEAVLRTAGVDISEIDDVAFAGTINIGSIPMNNDFSLEDGSYPAGQRLAETLDAMPGISALLRADAAVDLYRRIMPRLSAGRVTQMRQTIAGMGVPPPIASRATPLDHHDCHLASAYYASGEDECLVISNDGFGDALCAKVAIGRNGRLYEISSNSFFNSLGCYYNYATLLCGFPKGHHAGKTTGLAAYGDSAATAPVFAKFMHWDERRGCYVNNGGIFRNAIAALRRELGGFSREDIAAGVQKHNEDILVAMARHFIAKTGLRRLVLVGGVHANVKSNQRIAEIPGVERIVVFPNMGDGGLAAGAAWLSWAANGAKLPPRQTNYYLGPDLAGENEVARALGKAGLTFDRPGDMAKVVAERLAANKIVVRCAGRMEYGPRALGNRSILYPATDASVNGWLNKALNRTEFMPFAPVLREEDANTLLQNFNDVTSHTASYMTITYDVTERCKQEAPAVVHVDGTARPQVLSREDNAGYYDILTEYNRLTGRSTLVNTSFNMHEEPIVCSADDAIRSFLASGVDSMILGPFLVGNARTMTGDQPAPKEHQ